MKEALIMIHDEAYYSASEGIRDLVEALIGVRGIKVVASSEGYDGGFSPTFSFVSFDVKNMRALLRLTKKLFFVKKREEFPTKNESENGECVDGYWIECRYDTCRMCPFFFLIIYSPDKQKRMEWKEIIIGRLKNRG